MMTLAALFALGAAGCSPGNAPMDSGQGGIELSVDRVVVEDGGSTSLGAYAQARPGARRVPLNPATDLTWESSHPEVASVEAGVVRGLRPGETRVTARNTSGWTAHAQVIVESVPFALEFVGLPELRGEVAGLLPDSLTIRVIDRHGTPLPQVTVQFGTEDVGGAAAPASRLTDAEGVARVSWSLGVQAGPQRLQARLAQRPDRWTQVEAVALPGPVASVQLIPPSNPRVNGAPIPIAARLDDAFGNGVPGVPVSWTIISGGGSVRSLTDGTDQEGHLDAEWFLGDLRFEQTVSARPGNGNGGGQANHTLDLRGVTVSPSSGTIEMREGIQLTAVVTDNRGQVVDDSNLRWTSSDQAVASVSSEGLVHGVTPGTATITATANGRSDSAVITVLPGEEEVNTPPENDDGSEGDDSSSEEGGSGDGGGDGSGGNEGSGDEGEADPTVGSVGVSPGKSNLEKNQKVELHAVVLDDSGNPVEGKSIRWASSNPAVAQVEGSGASAVITALSSGSAAITAEVDGVTGAADVDVSEPTSPPPSVGGLIPAFPGAEGWGATALNECRALPLQILTVTSTAPSGPGTLDHAIQEVSSDHFTVVLFRTGGRILMPSGGSRLNASCVYFAGQTAPGDGVVIEGQGTAMWFRGGGPNISDIVMRHMRFRGRHGQTRNNLIIAKGDRIVLDHMSFSWTDNYLLALLRYGPSGAAGGPISNVSVQNSLLSEVFSVHPTAFVLGTNSELKDALEIGMTDISIHRNLMAHNSHRNPMSAADNVLIANNIIYNWRIGTSHLEHRGVGDFVNNYGKAGPQTRSNRTFMAMAQCTLANHPTHAYSIYASGNVGPLDPDGTSDQWSGDTRQVACYNTSGDYIGQAVPSEWRRDVPQRWASSPFPVSVRPAGDAMREVLGSVGASRGLTCEGNWVDMVDPVDRRVIREVEAGTGVSSPPESEQAVGGYPRYSEGTPCVDSDGDGLPDAWEARFFGCATCADPAATGKGGYLVIEHYLNGTSPR